MPGLGPPSGIRDSCRQTSSLPHSKVPRYMPPDHHTRFCTSDSSPWIGCTPTTCAWQGHQMACCCRALSKAIQVGQLPWGSTWVGKGLRTRIQGRGAPGNPETDSGRLGTSGHVTKAVVQLIPSSFLNFVCYQLQILSFSPKIYFEGIILQSCGQTWTGAE